MVHSMKILVETLSSTYLTLIEENMFVGNEK